MRLLLVEDNPENWDMLSRRLQRRGFEVLLAHDGRQALDVANAENPDLVLLDISLPVMNGWEVAAQLRLRQSQRRLPIIALTAHASDEDRQRAIDAGCDEYETKPIDFDALLQKIHALTRETVHGQP